MTGSALTTTPHVVPHLRLTSERPFDDVKRRLEATAPRLDPGIVAALRGDDVRTIDDFRDSGPDLSIFEVRDHGRLLASWGGARNALQYEIGNPLTASRMTHLKPAAGLYAPLRVILYEGEGGVGVFEYDQPSAQFGLFGDPEVEGVGLELDAEILKLLRAAAD